MSSLLQIACRRDSKEAYDRAFRAGETFFPDHLHLFAGALLPGNRSRLWLEFISSPLVSKIQYACAAVFIARFEALFPNADELVERCQQRLNRFQDSRQSRNADLQQQWEAEKLSDWQASLEISMENFAAFAERLIQRSRQLESLDLEGFSQLERTNVIRDLGQETLARRSLEDAEVEKSEDQLQKFLATSGLSYTALILRLKNGSFGSSADEQHVFQSAYHQLQQAVEDRLRPLVRSLCNLFVHVGRSIQDFGGIDQTRQLFLEKQTAILTDLRRAGNDFPLDEPAFYTEALENGDSYALQYLIQDNCPMPNELIQVVQHQASENFVEQFQHVEKKVRASMAEVLNFVADIDRHGISREHFSRLFRDLKIRAVVQQTPLLTLAQIQAAFPEKNIHQRLKGRLSRAQLGSDEAQTSTMSIDQLTMPFSKQYWTDLATEKPVLAASEPRRKPAHSKR